MSGQIVQFPLGYVEKIATCLKAHSINLGKPHSVKAAQSYLEEVSSELLTAAENLRAGKSNYHADDERIVVTWCEANEAFAVEVDGRAVEHYPTRKEALAYANQLSLGAVNGKEAREQA